jgi:hypothetical protein
MSDDGKQALVPVGESRPPAGHSDRPRSLTLRGAGTLALGAVAFGTLMTGALALGRLALVRPPLRNNPPRLERRHSPSMGIEVAWIRVTWTDHV